MTAIGSGTLVVVNGCIWLRNDFEDSLVIWSATYEATLVGGHIAITDTIDQTRAFIGDAVRLSGGQVDDDAVGRAHVEGLIGARIPDACLGRRYWIGGLMS